MGLARGWIYEPSPGTILKSPQATSIILQTCCFPGHRKPENGQGHLVCKTASPEPPTGASHARVRASRLPALPECLAQLRTLRWLQCRLACRTRLARR